MTVCSRQVLGETVITHKTVFILGLLTFQQVCTAVSQFYGGEETNVQPLLKSMAFFVYERVLFLLVVKSGRNVHCHN